MDLASVRKLINSGTLCISLKPISPPLSITLPNIPHSIAPELPHLAPLFLSFLVLLRLCPLYAKILKTLILVSFLIMKFIKGTLTYKSVTVL